MCPPPNPLSCKASQPDWPDLFLLSTLPGFASSSVPFLYQLACSQRLRCCVACHRNHVVKCGKLGVLVMARFQPSLRDSLLPAEEPSSHSAELSTVLPATLQTRCLALSVFDTQSLVRMIVFIIVLFPIFKQLQFMNSEPWLEASPKGCSQLTPQPWELGVDLRPSLLTFRGGSCQLGGTSGEHLSWFYLHINT